MSRITREFIMRVNKPTYDNTPHTLLSLWSVWCIGSNDIFMTFSTRTFEECSRISHVHSFFVSLVWMFGRNREMVFYVESEFLFDNLKWFSCYLTLHYSCEESIYVFLSYFKSDSLLIVLGYTERLEGPTVKGLLWCIVPIPSSRLHFRFCQREVFLSYCLIVTKGW